MRTCLRRLCGAVFCPVLFLSGFAALASAADEFTAPPKAEREVAAAIGKAGGRITVDAEYRITGLTLGAESTNDLLKSLAGCERLTQLTVSSRNITDDGLESLKALTKLTTMSITSSGISTEGVAALRAALPNCRVTSFGGGGGGRGPGGTAAARPAGGTPTADRGGGRTTGGPPGGFGGGGPGGGGFGAANRRGVELLRALVIQEELKLTDDQRQKLSNEKLTAAIAAVQKAHEDQALAALTPEQLTRFKQLEIQQQVPQVFLREDIVKQLELTAEQLAAIRKLMDDASAEARTAMTEAFRQRPEGGGPADTTKMQEQLTAISRARDEKIQAALNDKQRDAWKALVGPPGPRVGTPVSSFTGGGGFTTRPPADPAGAAKAYFDRYDTDKDGQLTDTELLPTGRARTSMAAAGIELKFPAAREDFEKAYAKYLEGTTRTVPVNSETAAKAIAALIDRDGDGSITETEFPADNRTRQSLTRAGAELKFPISREDLEKALAKYREQNPRTPERER